MLRKVSITASAIVKDYKVRKIKHDITANVSKGELHIWLFCNQFVVEFETPDGWMICGAFENTTDYETIQEYLINDFSGKPNKYYDQEYTFAEATKIWGLAESTLRKANYDKRFLAGEIRQSGTTWLVTGYAMERLYGERNA